MKKWGDMNKKEKITGVVGLFIIGFIFLMIVTPSSETEEQTKTTTQAEIISYESLSTEEKIQRIATQDLQGQNNMDKDYLKSVEVTGNETDGFIVDVEFNAGDNLSAGLRKTGIEKNMSKIYTALYNSDFNIDMVKVGAYFPLVDEYGNESDGLVYMSALPKEEAEKVNWEAQEATLQLDILPNLWTTISLHPEFK